MDAYPIRISLYELSRSICSVSKYEDVTRRSNLAVRNYPEDGDPRAGEADEGLFGREVQGIERTPHSLGPPRVDHGGSNVLVAEELLYGSDVMSAFEQMCGKRMTKAVCGGVWRCLPAPEDAHVVEAAGRTQSHLRFGA